MRLSAKRYELLALLLTVYALRPSRCSVHLLHQIPVRNPACVTLFGESGAAHPFLLTKILEVAPLFHSIHLSLPIRNVAALFFDTNSCFYIKCNSALQTLSEAKVAKKIRSVNATADAKHKVKMSCHASRKRTSSNRRLRNF